MSQHKFSSITTSGSVDLTIRICLYEPKYGEVLNWKWPTWFMKSSSIFKVFTSSLSSSLSWFFCYDYFLSNACQNVAKWSDLFLWMGEFFQMSKRCRNGVLLSNVRFSTCFRHRSDVEWITLTKRLFYISLGFLYPPSWQSFGTSVTLKNSYTIYELP